MLLLQDRMRWWLGELQADIPESLLASDVLEEAVSWFSTTLFSLWFWMLWFSRWFLQSLKWSFIHLFFNGMPPNTAILSFWSEHTLQWTLFLLVLVSLHFSFFVHGELCCNYMLPFNSKVIAVPVFVMKKHICTYPTFYIEKWTALTCHFSLF